MESAGRVEQRPAQRHYAGLASHCPDWPPWRKISNEWVNCPVWQLHNDNGITVPAEMALWDYSSLQKEVQSWPPNEPLKSSPNR
jgi:hypothetical protein